jgi:hypothetical protein
MQLVPLNPKPYTLNPKPYDEGQAAALRLLLNFAAHTRAQVVLVEQGLDRVLWANWWGCSRISFI